MLKILIPAATLFIALIYYYQIKKDEEEKAARIERNKSKLTLSE